MTLVDTNVLIDILSDDPVWLDWSEASLARQSVFGSTFINEVIYAELSARMTSESELTRAIAGLDIEFVRTPVAALFIAGKAYRRYRATGGVRTGVLPDFFIGAHALAADVPLLTRDTRRFRTYFPDVELITPE